MKRAWLLIMFLLPMVTMQPVCADDKGIDVLFDISKEADTLYGNPLIQGEALFALLDEEGISYSFTEKDDSLVFVDVSAYTILVLWDPDSPYDEDERKAIVSFVEQGGILLFAGTSLHNTQTAMLDSINDMLTTFGIILVSEQVVDMTNFVGCCGTTLFIHTFAEGYYFYDVREMIFSHTGYLELTPPAMAIAVGDDDTFVDSNNNSLHDTGEMMGAIPVIAQSTYGKGTVVVLGSEKIFENTYITMKDNKRFARNLFSDLLYLHRKDHASSSSPTYLYVVGGLAGVIVLTAAVLHFKKK